MEAACCSTSLPVGSSSSTVTSDSPGATSTISDCQDYVNTEIEMEIDQETRTVVSVLDRLKAASA